MLLMHGGRTDETTASLLHNVVDSMHTVAERCDCHVTSSANTLS